MRNFTWWLTSLAILLLLPLGHDLSRYRLSANLAWNDLGWLLAIFLILIFLVKRKELLKTQSVFLACLLTVCLLFHVGYHGIFFSHVPQWVRYGVFIWLPIVFACCLPKRSPYLRSLALVGIICLQAQWGIAQFVLQHDLGLQILGESHLSPSTSGVAKFLLGSQKVMRAYGPYGHPNPFAAVLVSGVFLAGYISVQGRQTGRKNFSALLPYILPVGYILCLALMLTFSRAAYLSLGLAVISLAAVGYRKRLGSWPLPCRQLWLLAAATLFVLMPFLAGRLTDPQDRGFVERQRGSLFAWQMMRQESASQFLFGHGIGTFADWLRSYLDTHTIAYQPWEIAPWHNALGLFAFETGAAGLLVAGAALGFIFYRNRRLMSATALIVPLLPLLLFDHYFLTSTAPFVFWCLAYITIGDMANLAAGRKQAR